MRSMTGFGRSEAETDFGLLSVELQSVNRKYLEITVYLPKDFSRFELDLRKEISLCLSRGYVTARYSLLPCSYGKNTFLHTPLLTSFASECKKVAKEIGCSPEEVTFPFLFSEVKNFSSFDENMLPEVKRHLLDVTKQAVKNLISMRQIEGEMLLKELQQRVVQIRNYLEQIEKKVPLTVDLYKEKIRKKLAEWSSLEQDERLMREVSFFADKTDISEEIQRMFSHLSQCENFFQQKQPGRKLEFLLQEMQRESTTMKAKSVDIETTMIIIEIQSELEKIREQVQNVE